MHVGLCVDSMAPYWLLVCFSFTVKVQDWTSLFSGEHISDSRFRSSLWSMLKNRALLLPCTVCSSLKYFCANFLPRLFWDISRMVPTCHVTVGFLGLGELPTFVGSSLEMVLPKAYSTRVLLSVGWSGSFGILKVMHYAHFQVHTFILGVY